jgi:hypothetical protein
MSNLLHSIILLVTYYKTINDNYSDQLSFGIVRFLHVLHQFANKDLFRVSKCFVFNAKNMYIYSNREISSFNVIFKCSTFL